MCILEEVEAHASAAAHTHTVNCVCCNVPVRAGATGGVGKRVVARLLAAGKHVRALVRDLEKAKNMLVSGLLGSIIGSMSLLSSS